ncbi:MAG: hypothetical protein V1773_01050 [bacterium]
MSLEYPVIGNNKNRLLLNQVEKVIILIEEGQEFVEAGYIDEGSIKLKFPANSITLMNKSTLQVGYNFSFEIKALQFYSLFEFEKLVNKNCTLNLHPLGIYIKNVPINIGGELTPGDNKSPITITGAKHVNKIREVIDGNPWGNLAEPWETGTITIPITTLNDTIGIENLL